MLHRTTRTRNASSTPGATQHRLSLKRGACLLAMGGVLTLAPVFAKEPSRTEARPTEKAASARAEPPSDEVLIPQCLDELNLTREQQDQIRQIVRGYDADLATVWQQFRDRYRETIETEVLLLSAIEDNLTDAQRNRVRDQRRKTARHEKSLAGTNGKPNQATTKPESAIEQELEIVGVSLTAEQELAADRLQEKYLSRLRSLNRDIQGLHTRLVSLEADKFVEIERVLTKDQLTRLREVRQNAPADSKMAARRSAPAKSE